MELQNEEFLQEIDELIQSRHLLTHPFYLAWSEGKLSRACLKEYAMDYYYHVKAFPTYLSALHSRAGEDMEMRRILLKNLIEEEAGSPNHPELWRDFVIAMGASKQELAQHWPNAEVIGLIETFDRLCRQASLPEGLAALYTYESQIPSICISKIDGLKKHYGMKNPKDWEYFRVHIAADEEHAAEERHLLKEWVDELHWDKVMLAVRSVLNALWDFLTGLCHRHGIVCSPSFV